MKIKILLLALLPACPAVAQQTKHNDDEAHAPVVKNLFLEEIRQMEVNTQLSSVNAANIPHLLTTESSAGLKEGFDYFDPELYFNNKIRDKEAVMPHEFTIRRNSNATIILDGVSHDDLECSVIEDRYSMRYPGYPEDYNYRNTTFVYQDKKGGTVASVVYIERNVGGLKTTHKLISKGLASVTEDKLSIMPNPAERTVNLQYDIVQKGSYSIRITDLSGRIVYTVQEPKDTAPGSYKLTVEPELPAGYYLVSLQSGTTAITQKLILK